MLAVDRVGMRCPARVGVSWINHRLLVADRSSLVNADRSE